MRPKRSHPYLYLNTLEMSSRCDLYSPKVSHHAAAADAIAWKHEPRSKPHSALHGHGLESADIWLAPITASSLPPLVVSFKNEAEWLAYGST